MAAVHSAATWTSPAPVRTPLASQLAEGLACEMCRSMMPIGRPRPDTDLITLHWSLLREVAKLS